jgi:DNA-binding transcriptional MerR regulator/methylmalonyl-CoA mutase cobalamin-binding subunit
MSSLSRTPTYNLKAVVQETGLKPDTLRAWERRYGLPEPRRTSSGHRIYSQRDIDILKWLITRQEEGLSISRAVALWQRLQAEGRDPLGEQGATEEAETPPATQANATVEIPAGTRVPELRQAWVSACLAFDEIVAEKILEQAFSIFSPETVCIEILQKGMAELGEGWLEGRVTEQQEHFASSLAMRRIQALLSTTPPPVRTERILIGCPPDEEHTFAPMLLSLLLRRKGWHVIYLGANVPLRNLENTIAAARPTLVVLTAQQLHTAASLMEMAELLEERRIPLAYGGRIFCESPDIQRCIPGYHLGSSLEGAIQAVEQIVTAPRPKPAEKRTSSVYVEALQAFRNERASIETDVWHNMRSVDVDDETLANANTFLGNNIIAALTLCDTAFLHQDLEWFHEILVNHYQMPDEVVDQYMAEYVRALQDHLGAQSEVIVHWLSNPNHHYSEYIMGNNGLGPDPA